MLAPSAASLQFDEILLHPGHPDSAAYINAMVGTVYETEHLDFKAGSKPDGQNLHDNEIKKIWGEAIAGFATTGGGVLIWGIDARRKPDSTVDQACELLLVNDPDGFASRLRTLVGQATDPPVSDVIVKSVPDASLVTNQGFVVCYIPESQHKPHRAELGKSKRWLMRVSDSFVDIQPSMLRSLFYPQIRSRIRVVAEFSWELVPAQNPEAVRVSCHIYVHNDGPATARELMIVIALPPSARASHQWKARQQAGLERHAYGLSLHPGDHTLFSHAWIDLPLNGPQPRELIIEQKPFNQFGLVVFAADRDVEELVFVPICHEIASRCGYEVTGVTPEQAGAERRFTYRQQPNGRNE